MSATALRPLRVGEVLDAGIKLYLRNARTLIGLAAVVVVPFQILNAIVLLSTVSTTDQVHSSFATSSQGDPASVAGSIVVFVLGLVVGVLTTAACVKAVSDAYLDNPADLRSSLRFALRRLRSLIWLDILWFVLLALAFVALIIPGIWMYAAWSVAVPALLVEGCRGLGALRRSFRLVRGRWWPTAGTLLVTNLMTGIVGAVIGGVLAALLALAGGSSVVVSVIIVSVTGAVGSVLTRPLQASVTTVLYYDLRVRREGYDVTLLAEQLGLPAASLPGAVGEGGTGPEAVGQPGGPPYWPPPPGWTPPALDS